jgi:Skp family chaperone for outer membrane proteins
MTRLINSIWIVLFVGAFFHAGIVQANDKPTMPAPIVAIIDVQKILQESQAAKNVQKQIDGQRSKFQAETEKEENALRQLEQGLGKARDSVTPEVYGDREQQLRQRTLIVERHVTTRRKILDQAFADAKNAMSATLQEITEAVAHEHGVNIVLLKQQVLWTDSALDVTNEILARLNKKLPNIDIKMGDEAKE